MKRQYLTGLLAAALLLCSCGESRYPAETAGEPAAASEQTESAGETESAEAVTEEPAQPVLPEVESCQADGDYFSEYTSNTYLSTGNNSWVRKAKNVTYRAYIPIEEYGKLTYSFYFSNTVDSTYNKGNPAYAGREGEGHTITSARVYDGGEGPEDEPAELARITFGGEETKDVAPGEVFYSDPVELDIPEGHYLLWEWTLDGAGIPALNMSDLAVSLQLGEYDEDFVYCSDIPLPVFIGAKRENVRNRVVAVGDSITQGCQTDSMEFEYWAAMIAKGLPEGSAFYNAGLGWARMSDIAKEGNWLGRAVNCDTAIIAFGTNDIGSGEYEGDGGNSAEEILDWLKVVIAQFKAAGTQHIIVFNAPPFDYKEDKEAVRTEYNEELRELCDQCGAEYFDFASYLSDPEDPAKARYGGHPTGEAGAIVAEAFLEQYGEFFQ